jgi:mono/diheme cytochrome c family protein
VRAIAAAAIGLAAATGGAPRAEATGEHERRLGAEVAVLLGDARRLSEPLPDRQLAGLVARIKGGLASLPLLIRQARENNPALAAPPPRALDGVRAALDRRDPPALRDALSTLARIYPFDTAGILPAQATPERLRAGRAIHKSTCAGCHDHPDGGSALPAHDLFGWARAMPTEEFAARLYAGVRGDALSARANPFGVEELAALIAYYYREAHER